MKGLNDGNWARVGKNLLLTRIRIFISFNNSRHLNRKAIGLKHGESRISYLFQLLSFVSKHCKKSKVSSKLHIFVIGSSMRCSLEYTLLKLSKLK